MRKFTVAVLLFGGLSPCFGQLTQSQKVSDFTGLAALYEKNYGPYTWKVNAFQYNLLQLQPWLDKISDSNDDLSFYDICVRYVASLNDFHDEFTLPSDYEAYLPFTADLYDGQVLVTFLDASFAAQYPISAGDEVVSVDGISAATWISMLTPYSVNGGGNPVSRNRIAVATMLDRYQAWYPYASAIQPGQVAKVVIRGARGTATYSIPWQTIYLPLLSEGPVPASSSQRVSLSSIRETALSATSRWKVAAHHHSLASDSTPDGMRGTADPHERLREFSHLHAKHVLAGALEPFGSLYPSFNPPPGFMERLGGRPDDNFVSGTFPVGHSTIGFIRIPGFGPANANAALAQFAGEIAFFQQHTRGLVIDVMSNGGGSICYAQELVRYLIPTPFRNLGFSLRATETWLEDFEHSLLYAENTAPQATIDEYAQLLGEVQQALAKEHGMTPPLPLCSSTLTGVPATDGNGNNLAYTKPMVVLTNNFTASAAEMFAATLQDARRVTVYGTRTSGGGGNVASFNTAPYAEGASRVTESLAVRNHSVSTPGYPSAPYIENIGVYPDISANYQTKINLLTSGEPFVAGFSAAISNLIANP